MEKMIGIINDNLRTVINGIKSHREDAEATLLSIQDEMDEKVNVASMYKNNVESAKNSIDSLENEISTLESNLEELRIKFNSADFKETLDAGNKEINSKIIEKRAKINEQAKIIKELTEKAHVLKEEVNALKERRYATEENLEQTKVLEKYYETRINEIISFSETNPGDLDSFIIELPKEHLSISSEELEGIGLDEVVDGSVFEEIDEISKDKSKIEKEKVDEVIENIQDDEEDDSSIKELDIDSIMAKQLDDIILSANDVLEKTSEVIKPAEEVIELSVDDSLDNQKIDETHIDDIPKVEENVLSDDNDIEIFKSLFEEEKDETVVNQVENEDITDKVIDEIVDFDSMVNPVMSEPESAINDFISESTNDIKMSEDNVISEATYSEPEAIDVNKVLEDCGLDAYTFREEDLAKLRYSLNKENANRIIEVLTKYNLPKENLYRNVNILTDVTPQNLDYLLNILKKNNIKDELIVMLFDRLDKINISKLEKEISRDLNRELIEILYEAMPYTATGELASKIGLTAQEEKELKKNTTDREYKIMDMFPDIVAMNYNSLNKFNINNIKECFIKHPRRFLNNPDKFSEMLDKYDPEDLVRCINKNSAVIDKL